jgi:hypothetical protein
LGVNEGTMLVFSAIPFALAAAVYPAGLVSVGWMLSRPRGLRHGVAYLGGAAASTLGSGALILLLMRYAGRAGDHPAIIGGFETATGAALVVASAWAAASRREPSLDVAQTRPRLAAGCLPSFLIGAAMWAPSLAYVAALEEIVNADLGVGAVVANLLVVAVIVLVLVELPLVAYAIVPSRSRAALGAARDAVARLGWRFGAAIACAGGAYLVWRGLRRLT